MAWLSNTKTNYNFLLQVFNKVIMVFASLCREMDQLKHEVRTICNHSLNFSLPQWGLEKFSATSKIIACVVS